MIYRNNCISNILDYSFIVGPMHFALCYDLSSWTSVNQCNSACWENSVNIYLKNRNKNMPPNEKMKADAQVIQQIDV